MIRDRDGTRLTRGTRQRVFDTRGSIHRIRRRALCVLSRLDARRTEPDANPERG